MSSVSIYKDNESLPSVIILNAGGVLFTTHLSTLLKFKDSLLCSMFSGRHAINRDEDGRPFLDVDPKYFGHILEYLRHETLPPVEIYLPMYRQACYYGIGPLVDRLKTTPVVAKVLVKEAYRDQFPQYGQLLRQIVNLALEKAISSYDRQGKVVLHIFQETFVPGNPDFNMDHDCVASTADLKVGPWDGPASPKDLLQCLTQDLRGEGFEVSSAPNVSQTCGYCCGNTWSENEEHCPKRTFEVTIFF